MCGSSPGQTAPTVGGSTLQGSALAAHALRGKPVVIDFWASWCGPCRAQQRQLNSLARRYGPLGAEFVGVDIRDDLAAARAYEREHGVPYPSIFDPSADTAARFDVTAPPTTIVVDRGGRVAGCALGTGDLLQVGRLIDRALASPA